MKLKMLGILCLYSIGTQCVWTKEDAAILESAQATLESNHPVRLALEAKLERENSSDSDSGRSSASTPPLHVAKAYAAVCGGGSGACVADQASKMSDSGACVADQASKMSDSGACVADQASKMSDISPDNKVCGNVRPKKPKPRPDWTRRDLEYWINQGSSI